MTAEQKSPADRLLDLLVFGPAGLALTAAEEFPRLVEKGRHRVEGQVHAARLVGQFAVQMGRRQLESTLSVFKPGPSPVRSQPPVSSAVAGEERSTAPQSLAQPAAGEGATVASPSQPAASGNGALGSDVLGIPGYDSLSASQVVQRLGGLSPAELETVRDHELAHRHRRTILNRVEQLLAADSAHD